ncbi:hypothetical protein [Amycolatopsis sp. NPDC001319]|uniref:hypothetical protein n=1 Tax=unclassified Amycolatopsis TaxID=2618356 RepID=UPI00368AA674
MCLHIVLISLGYAMTDHSGLIAEVWSLVTTYPGILLATAGTVALVLVVLTSVWAPRRRLRHESWHLLHLYSYLGVSVHSEPCSTCQTLVATCRLSLLSTSLRSRSVISRIRPSR